MVEAINDKGNFSFHACYRLEAILSELQKLGLELPPQINCFIQSMTRMQNMFDNNFSGVDKVLLGASAKSISREIGGSFFESFETTTNRLVRGAKVLGENDARNTNVDSIQIPDDDENRIELDV